MFKVIAVPTSPTDLRTLLDIAQVRADHGIALQAPVGNVADVNFGDANSQPAFVPPGSSSDILPFNRLDSLYIVGTAGDAIIVMIF